MIAAKLSYFVVLAFTLAVLASFAGTSETSAGGIVVDSAGEGSDANAGDGICATAGGDCTFRAAINETIALGGDQTITFDIPTDDPNYDEATNVWTISPTATFAGVRANVDARTQPGYQAAGRPVIHIDGSNVLADVDGLFIGADNLTIAGLAISGFRDAVGGFSQGSQIIINGHTGTTIEDNYLGIDPTGEPNFGGSAGPSGSLNPISYRGVWVVNSQSTELWRNVISGNSFYGVHIQASSGTVVADNLIGTNGDGSQDVGNGRYGVYVTTSPNTYIGEEGAGNVVSGNGTQYLDAGIFVFQPGIVATSPGASAQPPGPAVPSGTSPGGILDIRDNQIGTNAACTGAIPNVNGIVAIDSGSTLLDWTAVNVIGNTISGNGGGPSSPGAAEAALLQPQGGPVVAGDGFVWVAPSPEGPVTFTDNNVGADCDGQDPIANQGRGALLGLSPGSTPSAPFGAEPALLPLYPPPPRWFVERNLFLANALDCIDMDFFFDLFDTETEVEGFLAFLDNALRNCGDDGFVLSILLDSLADWADAIEFDISGNDFSGNGGDGFRAGYGGETGEGPDLNLNNNNAGGNGGSGSVLGFLEPDGTNPDYHVPIAVSRGTQGLTQSYPHVTVSNLSSHDNGGAGLAIIQGPLPQSASARGPSALPVGVSLEASTFYNNGGLAIDLNNDGVTPNDAGDTDVGPNGLLNFPVLTSAVAGSVTITGTYDGLPNTDVDLRFYSNPQCDSSGNGEGHTFIGSHEVTTDGAGHVAFETTFDTNPPGKFVSATASVAGVGTSEFSNCIEGDGLGGILGDVDCDGDVDAVDALGVLRSVGGLGDPDCLAQGDVDCDGDVDAADALGILRHVAALPVNQQQPCPQIAT